MTGIHCQLVVWFTFLVNWSVGEMPTNPPSDVGDTIDRGIALMEMPDTLIVLKKQPLTINCSVIAEKGFEPIGFRWAKDGEVIKKHNRSRVRVLENGTLYFRQIIHRDRVRVRSDEGFYECFVENSYGTIIGRRVAVKVARISKTFSQEPKSKKARIGSIVVFNCSIDAVTEPHYAWEKDGQHIKTVEPKYLLYQSGKLQINDVHPSDAGSYKCIAANKDLFGIEGASVAFRWRNGKEVELDVEEERRTDAYMAVLGAPANQTTVRWGDMTTLECIVDGYPLPIVTWTKDGHDVLFPDVDKLRGGSLRFKKVRKAHAGQYKCQARHPNSDLVRELTTTLTVLVDPVIEIGPVSAMHPVAKLMRLECKVTGQPKPKVRWIKNGQDLFDHGRAEAVEKDGTNLLRIYVDDTDSGYYQCLAENGAGRTSSIARIEIELKDNAPNRPENVKVKVISKSEAEVSWDIREKNDSLPIISYTVHFRKENSLAAEDVEISNTRNWTISKLDSGTNYTVYVKAYKKSGASPSSNVVHFTTHESVPKSYPRPTLKSRSASTILIEWEAIPKDLRGGVIINYTIFYGLCDSNDIKNVTVDGKTNQHLLIGLFPDQKYQIRILGATKKGYPVLSDEKWPWIFHRTLKRTSGNHVTPNVTIKDINTTTVKVAWEYPENVAMTKQVIFLRNLHQTGVMQMYNLDDKMREIYFQNLVPETMYEFFILGEHGTKQTGMVTKIFSTRSNTSLGGNRVPTHVTGTPFQSNAIAVKWRYIGSNDPEITHYIVRYQPIRSDHMCSNIPEKSITTRSQEAVLTDLQPYTIYNISVCAVFEETKSQYSRSLLVRTLEDVPSPPENVEAMVLSPGKVRLQWTPPHHPNGFIRGHVISYNMELVKHHLWTEVYQEGQDTAALVQNLTARTYIFRVQACNGAGKSLPSSKLVVHMEHVPTKESHGLSDQQLGILGGAGIGLTSILITIIVVYCKQRQFYRRYVGSGEARTVTTAVDVSGPGAVATCVCQREGTQPRSEMAQVAMAPKPPANPPVDSNKGVDVLLSAMMGGRIYNDGDNTKAEELLALLASRDGAYSASGDSQSASTEGTKEDLSDDTVTTDDVTTQLTHDTAC